MTLTPTLRSTLIIITSFIFVITAVSAWTGPSVPAPDGNVSAPLTISATSQSKAGGLDVGWLSAVGAVKVGYTATACSVELAGSLRWNTGVMEYCNGTVWGPFVGSSTGGGGGGNDSPYCAYTGQTQSVNLSLAHYVNASAVCTMSVDATGYQTLSVSSNGDGTGTGAGIPASCSKSGYNVDSLPACTYTLWMSSDTPVGMEATVSFNRTTGVLSCNLREVGGESRSGSYTFPKDESMCSTGGGAETDPTVLTSVKDGVSWSEVTGKPTNFSGNFSHVIENVNPTSCSNVNQLLCGSGKYGVTVMSSPQSEVQTGYSCMCFWN